MPRLTELFESKYLKPSDVKGRRVTLTMASLGHEQIGTDRRLVARFVETEKRLALNRTNATRIAQVVGNDDTDTWPGHRITLGVEPCDFRGAVVDAVRVVVAVGQPAAATPTTSAKPADPFGGLCDGPDF